MATATHTADQEARERIRDDLDATLFAEAGAGTGKTHELIERILRLVSTGRAELRRIAAITFTEAAAAELRDRVRMRLEEAARGAAQLPEGERERCRAALADVDAAAIETLHGFAQRILTSHPLEAGLPPAVEVQDEIRASISFDERWAAFVDELLDDASLEDVLLRAFTMGLQVDDLRRVAEEFHENWDRLEDIEIEGAPMPKIDAAPLLELLAGACDARTRCVDPDDLLYQHLEGVETYRRRLGNAGPDLDTLRILSERAPLKFSYGQQANWRGIAPDDIRRELRATDEMRDELRRRARAGVLPPLLAALRSFILRYADERRRAGRLEFHDLLVQARRLLRQSAPVRRAVREQFSHLLIDEFQDTDPLQIEIAMLIAGREAEGTPPRWDEAIVDEGRLFFVGDPKQSIYRFRRADIELYQRVQQGFADAAVYLTQNFRSLSPVIDWVNHVFEQLMAPGDGQATYVPLAASWRAPKEAGVTVRLLGGPATDNVSSIRRREAREIARVIQSVKAEGWPVTRVSSDGARSTEPARYADIALLMPARTTLPPIEEALEQAGIPYRVESQSLVYDTQEVRDLLAILRSIDDATDQVALIAALRSPAFACGDDDLLRFHRARGRWDYRRGPPAGLAADDPVVAALAALRELHERRWWEPISGVVEAVIRERRLFELAFAHQRPRERWQRLRFALDQARAFAEAGGRTLRQFIDWAERQADEGTRVVETVVPEPDDDAVRIMTIHAAKGLEFPVVVLMGLNIQSGRQGERGAVLWHEDGRPEARLGSGDSGSTFETSGYEELAGREKEMNRREQIRLLYVAATRARDHLVVSLHHKGDESAKEGERTHAARLYERSSEAPELWRGIQLSLLPPPPAEPAAIAGPNDSSDRRRAWLESRQDQIERLGRVRAVAATEIAHAAEG
ncbi:MAG: UvrD-helicase domain-containing protein, partial [Dehalococcoidia bacterium]|nr:UvrD-helicase domain-containing protein [Dehalococcoidia bacterium]